VHGYHQHGHARVLLLHVLDKLQSAFARNGDVRQNQVGAGCLDGRQRLGRAFRFPAYGQVPLVIDELGQTVPGEGMIVEDENSPPSSDSSPASSGFHLMLLASGTAAPRYGAYHAGSAPRMGFNLERAADDLGTVAA